MDAKELESLIAKLERTVAKLNHERPRSAEHNHEAGILKDAKQLLHEQRTRSFSDREAIVGELDTARLVREERDSR